MADRIALKYTTLGAASLITGMSFWVKNKWMITPAFWAGWISIAYGVTNGFKNFDDKLMLAGLGAITSGGALARMHMDWGILEKASKFGKPIFMGGWLAFMTALANKNKATQGNAAYIQAYASMALLIAGVMMIRMKQIMGKLENLPAAVGPMAFALAWIGVISTAGGLSLADGAKEIFTGKTLALTG